MILRSCQNPDSTKVSFYDSLASAVARRSVGIRFSSEDDEDFLKQLYADVRKAEVGSWGWSDEMIRHFLEMQFRAQSGAYLAGFSDADDLLLLDGNVPFGRVLVEESGQVLRLVDFAMLEGYRGNGLGALILEHLKAYASGQDKAVALSVQRVNRAVGLYIRCGFDLAGGDDVYVQMRWSPMDHECG